MFQDRNDSVKEALSVAEGRNSQGLTLSADSAVSAVSALIVVPDRRAQWVSA
jgi:hypothetical protein